MAATPTNQKDPDPIVITIDQARVNNFITLISSYGGGNVRRAIETVGYPGGSYVVDEMIVTNNGKTITLITSLAILAPGGVLVTLSNDGFIIPALDLTKISQASIYPGINDFNIKPIVPLPVVPDPINIRLVGGIIQGGDGTRHYALSSPFDHFIDGGLFGQDGKIYRKVMVQNAFGFAIEWDEVTVVGA